MKWVLIEKYSLWFYFAIFLLIAVDVYLIVKHFRNRREDTLELISRILGSNFFGFYLIYRIVLRVHDVLRFSQAQTWQSWLQWILIVLPFALFFWTYLFRAPARVTANRMREIVFPFFCALLPFAIYESSSLVHLSWVHKTPFIRQILKPFFPGGFELYQLAAFILILLGDLIALWGLIYLRKSFSIMTEVRNWVHQGPYRFIRHPMYAGETLATMGFCLLKFSYLNIFLTLIFIFCIVLRARFEEAKISQFYPEYSAYRARSGFFLPRWKAFS